MELGAAELTLTEVQDTIRDGQPNGAEESSSKRNYPCDDDEEASESKKLKLEENDENLECLKNLCELVAVNAVNSLPCDSEATTAGQQAETKPDLSAVKKKKKKKRKPKKPGGEAAEDASAKESGTKTTKDGKSSKTPKKTSKSHMRKNIRDILKENELEAETRAAQQREIERVQRLQQQQQQQQQRQQQLAECNFVPSFEVEEDDSNPASSLVEGLQALAQELEDSTLSPEIPLDFIHDDHHEDLKAVSSSSSDIPPPIQDGPQPAKASQANDYDDVICLSSDEEALPPKPPPPIPSKPYVPYDDDDVVILSDDDEKPEVADDEEGDVHNFGLHTRDELNQPDCEGRVLVNVGHPHAEIDIFLPPQLARAAKPHQIGGIRFMYDNVVESLEQYAISPGFGCILAHSMGLGKTFQVCTFSEVFLRHTTARTVLVIVPINTIQNWVAEYNSWLPAERGPSEAPMDPSIQPRSFQLHVLNDATKDFNSRFRVINDWSTQGGVLLIGYEMYRLFYTQRESKVKKNGPKKKKASAGVVDLEEEEKEKVFLERIYQALVNPGPDLVICDEGHRIKNMKTGIAVALKEIRTKRRIVLTGYPLQNNLLEYWCMVDFVRPNFLGTRAEFGNMFERPIQNGQCVDSSPADVKLMKERVYVLHSLVKGFVQRRSHAVLRTSLPHKEEHVLLLRLTPLQRALYRHHMSDLVQNKSVSNPLKAFAICLKIWNHPDVLYNFVKKSQDDVDLDLLDEESSESNRKKKKKNRSIAAPPTPAASAAASPNLPTLQAPPCSTTDDETGDGGRMTDPAHAATASSGPLASQGANPVAKEKKEELSTLEWANEMLKGYIPGDIENAAKTQIFFTILEESVRISDRLLVFSQSLFTLNLLEEFLQQRPIPGRQDERWAKNRSYFRLDGSTNGMEREKLVNEFNSNPDVMLFLISTRAGSLGINLIGANRVIVFDASWNPCHDAQAVCRVYRYGQKKRCYIYRLVTDNSLEKKIYDRQIGKQGTADRVVDELNPEARLSLKDVTCLVCDDEEDPPPKDYGLDRTQSLSLNDPILERVLERWGSSFTKDPFQHDTLLAESKESKLSKAEKRMAQRLYEKAKMDGSMQYRRPNYSAYYPKVPVPIPSMDNGHGGSSNGGPYARSNSGYPSVRPSGYPGRPIINTPSQGLGMDMLAEALAQGKLVCKEMVLTKDVTIARNQLGNGAESSPIVLPVGTRVKLIKTPKGIYMQTPEGKIFRIHSSAPATPSSPSTIAAALGIGGNQPPSAGSAPKTSSLMDSAMLKRLREMQQQKPLGSEGNKPSISFSDKSALLAQIRHNLAMGKGPSGKGGGGGQPASSLLAGKLGLPLPPSSSGSHPHLNQFAKHLAALAQKSAADSVTDLVGLSGSESENGGKNGSSPGRPSSLLDPKARALPSASLPKKVPSISPNVSKARFFTPNRPLAPADPSTKASSADEARSPPSEAQILESMCSPTSSLSALSALSASPMASASASLARLSEMPSDLGSFASTTDGRSSGSNSNGNNSRSGLFDNLSLASQLEGFASSTSKTVTSAAESLKDLLKATPSTASNGLPAPSPFGTGTQQWSAGSSNPSTLGSGFPTWSNYAQWNPTSPWNGAPVAGHNNLNNWTGSNQWPQSLQHPLQQSADRSDFAGTSGGADGNGVTPTTSAASGSGATEHYGNQQQYSNFHGVNNSQWPSAFVTNTTSASADATAASYPSHSQANGQYPGPPSYFPANSYLSTAPYGNYYPQGTSQADFPNGTASYNLNHQYQGARGSSSITPGYPQPYPGSFSQ